jgi:hypothetical protein
VPDVARLLQAFVAPAIFISAAALLMLSLNVRLMGIVTRMRQFHREKHVAAQAGKVQEAQAVAEQIISIEHRAERIRKACLFVLMSLAGTIFTCLLLGLAVVAPGAEPFAGVMLVLSIFALLVGTIYYISEIGMALRSVREESKYFHLIDVVVLSRTDSHAAADERGEH